MLVIDIPLASSNHMIVRKRLVIPVSVHLRVPTTGQAQGLLNRLTKVTECLECDATDVYLLKPRLWQ